jgi:rhodanese-related sulfurtransferase
MRTIDTDELRDILDSNGNVALINVLPAEKFEEKHIPDSINIPIASPRFEEQVEEAVGDKSATVIVYCANEACDASPKAAVKLGEAGFEDVIDYSGGTQAWEQAGHPTHAAV